MNLNETQYHEGTPIDGYGPGFFRIGGTIRDGAVLILPGGVTGWEAWDTAPIAAAAGSIDIILVGTGTEISHVPEAFRRELEVAGLGVELMASAQACRTYNVLVGEGRRIGAALLPT